jgi:hypothetical protein
MYTRDKIEKGNSKRSKTKKKQKKKGKLINERGDKRKTKQN